MRVVLTHNEDKENDFVNGMGATLDAYDAAAGCMEVITDTGKRLSFGKRTAVVEIPVGDDGEVRKWTASAYPVRVGYASTVYKVQGMTLDHVTIWLDRAGARAAGYVALSRVKADSDYLIAGRVTRAHFAPAAGIPGQRFSVASHVCAHLRSTCIWSFMSSGADRSQVSCISRHIGLHEKNDTQLLSEIVPASVDDNPSTL